LQGKWTPEEKNAISMEEGIAKTLNLKLGDQLRFEISGQPYEAQITSLRRVDWTSMRANFFAIYPVSQLPDIPKTYIAAYRAPTQTGFDNGLVNRFPNVTNVDMGATINQVQKVLGQVIGAVEFLFGFTLAAGLVVLFAAVTATREERTREFAIMLALGGRASLLRQVQRTELAGVGLLAGLLAGWSAAAGDTTVRTLVTATSTAVRRRILLLLVARSSSEGGDSTVWPRGSQPDRFDHHFQIVAETPC
jgi:putative ABC transport system permease protein